MKKILLTLILLALPLVVFAAPTYRLERSLMPETTNTYELGTSTLQWLRGTFQNLCLNGDCRSVWPSSGSSFGKTWEIISGLLTPTTTIPVKLPAQLYASSTALINGTTTIGDSLSNLSIGNNAISGGNIPIIKPTSPLGSLGFLNGQWFVKEDKDSSLEPALNLISDDLSTSAGLSFSTSTGSLTVGAPGIIGLGGSQIYLGGTATTTSSVGINIFDGCYAVNSVCIGGSSMFTTTTPDYVVYNQGGVTKALKTITNSILASGSADTVLNAIVTDSPSGASIGIRSGTYYLNSTTTFKGSNSGDISAPIWNIYGAGQNTTNFVVNNDTDGFFFKDSVKTNLSGITFYLKGASNAILASSTSGYRSLWNSNFENLSVFGTTTNSTGYGFKLVNDDHNNYTNIYFNNIGSCFRSATDANGLFNPGDSTLSNVWCSFSTPSGSGVSKNSYTSGVGYEFTSAISTVVNQNTLINVGGYDPDGTRTYMRLKHAKHIRGIGLESEGFATTTEAYDTSQFNFLDFEYVIATSTTNVYHYFDSTSNDNVVGCTYVNSYAGTQLLFADNNTNAGFPNVLQGVNGANCTLNGSGTFTYSTTSASIIRDIRDAIAGNSFYSNVKILGDKLGLNFGSGLSSWIAHNTALNAIQFFQNSIARMTINSTGVGIGTTSPQATLDVSANDSNTSTSTGNQAAIRITNRNTTNNNMSELSFVSNDINGLGLRNAAIMGITTSHTPGAMSGDLAFLTRNSGIFDERMRLVSNGNFGIGTTSAGTLLSLGNTGGINFTLGTSTFNATGGINIKSGCYAINGVCVVGGTGSNFPTSTNPLMATYFVSTSTTQASNFLGGVTVSGATSTFNGIQVNNTYGLQFQGYASNPQVFAGDPTTGMHFDGPGILSFHNGGVQTMLLNALNNVGIGKTPSTKLDVAGTASSSDLYVNNKIGISTTSPVASLAISSTLGVPPLVIASSSAGQPASIYVDGTSGNVGFGTSTPPSRLTFASVGSGNFQVGAMNDLGANYTAFALNGINLGSTTYNFASSPSDQNRTLFINRPLGGDIRFRENNSNINNKQDQMVLLSNGNVGIGTSSPSNYFTLATTTDSDNSTILVETKNSTIGTTPKGCIEFSTPVSTLAGQAFDSGRLCSGFVVAGSGYSRSGIYFQYPTAMDTWTNGLILRGTGNVGVATDTPFARLSVQGTTTDSLTTSLFNVASSTSSTILNILANGLVSIGTTTPTVALDVTGTTTVRGASNGASISIGTFPIGSSLRGLVSATDNTSPTANKILGLGGGSVYITNYGLNNLATQDVSLVLQDYKSGLAGLIGYASSTGTLQMNPGSGNNIYLNVASGGDVGIATSSPVTTLSVTGAGGQTFGSIIAADDADSDFTTLDPNYGVSFNRAASYINNNNIGGRIIFRTSGSAIQDRVSGAFTSTGQFGIGTTTPARPLTVYRAGERGGLLLVDGAGTPVDSTTQGGTYLFTEAGVFGIGGQNSLGVGSTVRLTIDQVNGRVGISSTTPFKGFSVSGSVAFAPGSITTNTGASIYSLCMGNSGEMTKNSDAETCIASSERFKKNIETLAIGLDEVLKLRPVSFEMKDESNKGVKYGLIAEEAQKVDPRLVSLDEQGLPNGIHWSFLTSLNTKAIQELNTKVDNLKLGKVVVEAKRSAEENWQWIAIALLALVVGYQGYIIRKIKK
jgi:hypothetical protein